MVRRGPIVERAMRHPADSLSHAGESLANWN